MFTVIGTITVDLFVSNLTHMPHTEGDEFTVDSLVFHDDPLRLAGGGNGAITAYVLARLNASVELIGGLGTDDLGTWMQDWLSAVGVGMDGVSRCRDEGTATTLILSDTQQNRAAFYHPGANTRVDSKAISGPSVRDADLLLLTSYSILPGLRAQGCVELFQNAQRFGTRTALDIGPAIGEPVRLAELRPLLPHTDFFICNDHELQVCSGQADISAGMADILDSGTGCVVIKRGAAGATVAYSSGLATVAPGNRSAVTGHCCVDVPGFSVKVQSTVGAGDSFNAGFLLAIQEGADVVQAARFGNAVAATVVSTPGRALHTLSRADVHNISGP